MDEQQAKSNKIFSFKFPKIGLIVAIAIVGIIVLLLLVDVVNKGNEKEIITSSNLEKIINVSELSTYEAVYNGIAKVKNGEKPETIDYYVSYEAKIKAGIDFEQVKIEVDNKSKKISVTIPQIQITDVNVDITSLDYIFEDKKADTETVSEEAYKECINDVKNETTKENAIYQLAEQNAKNIIEALITPFIEQLDSEYKLEIK